MKQQKTLHLVQLAMLSAITLILAFVPYLGYIRLPILAIQATTVHIPVIVGSIILGPKSGAFLGGVFGLTSLINNTVTPGIISFCFSPFIQIGEGLGGSPLALIICFVPRILCGILPYYIYNFLSKLSTKSFVSKRLSVISAGIVGSLTNTILVMGMIYLFFAKEYAAARDIPVQAVIGAILSVVFINGVLEAITASLISFVAVTAIKKIS